MNRILIIASILAIVFSGYVSADVRFQGSESEVITITPEKATGLDNIYVIHDTKGVTIQYDGTSQNVSWYRFSNLGGGYAEEITNVNKSGYTSSVALEGDIGYIIEDGDKRVYLWIVDYSNHLLKLEGITIPPSQQCDNTQVNLHGIGDAIHYYTINGQQRTLSRDIEINYDTQQWDEDSNSYATVKASKELEFLSQNVYITPAVYCNTYFVVTGDRFLKQWGEAQTKESEYFTANAVDVHAEAYQESTDTDEDYKSNQINSGINGLGGSAPANITFNAYCTDAVIHYEWQMADDADFENITYRFNERDLDYTFLNEGTVYLRFIGSNSTGSCEQYSDVFTVTIGSSELKCPNAFSPGATEGVNDEWKVSYRSLIEFECWIFDRYGNELCHFTDPELGWDGKRNGKLVKPGVYFYVIQAKGADGKHYKKSGDINILRYSTYGNSNSTVE